MAGRRLLLALVLGIASIASVAPAQQMYIGVGVSGTGGVSAHVLPGSGAANLGSLAGSVSLGQRFALPGGFWGWEANADLTLGAETAAAAGPCSAGATGPYLCRHQATLRLVGVLGKAIGPDDAVFGTLGVGRVTGEFATARWDVGFDHVAGLTAGLGISHSLGRDMNVQGELAYDAFGPARQTSGWQSGYWGTSLRVMLVRKF